MSVSVTDTQSLAEGVKNA